MPKVSIVVPVYHNELNLPKLFERLYGIGAQNKFDIEFVFVDDGSQDGSFSLLKTQADKDDRVKVIKLSRNFGSFVASLAGLRNATGDCVVLISADLQDPPEMIPEMVDAWLSGFKVVLAVRENRKDSFWVTKTSNFFYWLMQKIALREMPLGGFDFFLIDRQVADTISRLEEKNTSLIGLIIWLGFKRKILHYTREERELGKSMWTFTKKLKYFIDSIAAFSYFPLRMASVVGVSISFVAFLYILYIFFMYFFLVQPPTGWSTMMVVVLFLSGIQLTILGVIGEYLWRNLDETRKRPVYIVDETLGVENPK